jgi:hypothetical protein
MVRPSGVFLVAMGWLAACGSSAKPISLAQTDGGDATGAAGTGAAGTTGTAGTGAAGTGTAGTSAAGTSVLPPNCGGDLVGEWAGSDPHAHPAAPAAPADPCYQLAVFPQDDGTFGATTRWFAPQRRDAILKFDAEHFAWGVTDRGPVTITYAASCLAKTAPRPTCAQLAEGLLISGLGEGSVRAVDCADAAGGCKCTFSIIETSGPAGTWTTANGVVTLVSIFGTQGQAKTVQAPYCVDGGTLRFGAAVDAFVAGLSRMTFAPFDCDDGKQGAVEDGVDCGLYCGKDCP